MMAERAQSTSEGRSPLLFVVLTFVLAIPFLVLGGATGIELLPRLPIAAFMAVCPALAALILVWREEGRAGAIALLRRAGDVARIRPLVWFVPILLLEPLLKVLSFVVLRMSGTSVPLPSISVMPALALFAFFLVGALCEELGWSGYAIDPLQRRWGALASALMLGLVWAVFHYIALLQAHRPAEWIAWWTLGTVASRVLIVWLYNNAGRSVAAAALFHTMGNLAWQLFPVHGSYFDPKISGLLSAAAALAILPRLRGRRTISA